MTDFTNQPDVQPTSMPIREAVKLEAQVVGKYKLGRVLGAGDFDCRIRVCHHVTTGLEYAVKIYSKKVLAEHQSVWEQIRDSIQVMRTLPKHEHLVEMVECFETEQSLYILMQFAPGTSILKVYRTGERSNVVSMERTKVLFAQIVWGMYLLHSANVVHQGLAPDHVIANDGNMVKIGFLVNCKAVPKGTQLNVVRGTTHTVAPEVLNRKPYDPYKADMWSIGIVLYFMLSGGRYPFDGANTAAHIRAYDYRPLNPSLPEEAKDVVVKLLKREPEQRMTMEQLLEHPFFVTANSECIYTVANINPAMSPRPAAVDQEERQHRSYVSATIADGGVSIRLPKGLDERQEAAYIIQHTWRLTRSLSMMEKTGVSTANMTTEDLFESTRHHASFKPKTFRGLPEPEKPTIKVGGFSAHSPRAHGTGASGNPPNLRTPAVVGFHPHPPDLRITTPGERGAGASGHAPQHLTTQTSDGPFDPRTPHLWDSNSQNHSFSPEEFRHLGDEVNLINDDGSPSQSTHNHPDPFARPNTGGFAMSNMYQCPACGRLPPPRVLGGKPPYSDIKLRYSVKDGKFKEKQAVLPPLSSDKGSGPNSTFSSKRSSAVVAVGTSGASPVPVIRLGSELIPQFAAKRSL